MAVEKDGARLADLKRRFLVEPLTGPDVTQMDRVDLLLLFLKQLPSEWPNREEVVFLMKKMRQSGIGKELDEERLTARHCLAAGNTRLAVAMAKRYRGKGLEFLDLIQAGNEGLMIGMDKYDPSLGSKFSTYVTWWVRRTIIRALSSEGRAIRLPDHVAVGLRKMHQVEGKLRNELDRKPTYAEVGLAMGLIEPSIAREIEQAIREGQPLRPFLRDELKKAADRVEYLKRVELYEGASVSMDKPVEAKDGDGGDRGEVITGPMVVDVEEVVADRELLGQLDWLLRQLSLRQEQVLRWRHGLVLPGRRYSRSEIIDVLTDGGRATRKVQDKIMVTLRRVTAEVDRLRNEGWAEAEILDAMEGVRLVWVADWNNLERERAVRIAELYMGSGNSDKVSLVDIGAALGVTRQRVEQIENGAEKALRDLVASKPELAGALRLMVEAGVDWDAYNQKRMQGLRAKYGEEATVDDWLEDQDNCIELTAGRGVKRKDLAGLIRAKNEEASRSAVFNLETEWKKDLGVLSVGRRVKLDSGMSVVIYSKAEARRFLEFIAGKNPEKLLLPLGNGGAIDSGENSN